MSGLYNCLKHKRFDDITISDIQKESSVGRATFYRLFDNMNDVLEYECNNVFEQMLSEYKNKCNNKLIVTDQFEAMFLFFMEYWINHPLLIEAITSENRAHIINKVYRNHAEEIGYFLAPNEELSKVEIDYLTSIIIGAIGGAFYMWLKNGRKDTAKELLQFFRKTWKVISISLLD